METAMRTGATILAIAVLLGLLATVGWYAYAGLTGPGEPMPSDNYIALVIGGLAVALVGMALMASYSIAAGAAMTSHLTFTETLTKSVAAKSAMARRGSATEPAGTNEPFGSRIPVLWSCSV
jgi:hypothetical protein